jgi:mono/diheme cytochrome c family protein
MKSPAGQNVLRTGRRAFRVSSILAVPVLVVASLAASVDLSLLPPAAKRTVDYEKDIRPVFEKSCLSCHGPSKQKGGLRLDSRAGALKGGDGFEAAIRPGDSAASPLIHLVAGLVADSRMPAEGEPLNRDQIGLLRAWIDQGALWPAADAAEASPAATHWAFKPVVRPQVPSEGNTPSANPIDAFVASRLSQDGLGMSPEADRTTLMRRLYFVMLGVPPGPDEVSAFVSDIRPDAFERLVDRVLDDPRYGERWGRHWLDVVRFAESNGFETNRERTSAWRFRDYVIAAFNDDVPYDRFVREQLAGDVTGADVATGFLVGGPVDIVGSPDPALTLQQRADELDDMVSTTGTAFLGLTIGCARCHSHKFDPVSHREYYSLTAIFSGVRHGERALPMTQEQRVRLADLDSKIAGTETALLPFVDRDAIPKRPAVNARSNDETFSPIEAAFVRFTVLEANSGEPCIDELEIWAGGRNVALASNGTKASASGSLQGYDIHKLEHINDGRTGNERSWISSEPGGGWVMLALPKAERVDRIVWGRDRSGKIGDRLATRYRIEAALDTNNWVQIASSDDRLPYGDASAKPGPVYKFTGLASAEAERGKGLLAALESLRKEREAAAQPPVAYAGNFSEPPASYRLHRGDPMQKREEVAPGTLELFKPVTLSTNAPERQRREALANWIANRDNPLTARVFVNRVWQHHFGVGLVSTPNDFGKNGSPPSHPDLLDWLADEFVASGWSVKTLQRRILTSATWRQSDAPVAAGLRADAGSRLLWRFPPRRLEAEAIRDSVLAVSGELDRTAGGPGFFLHDVDRENVYHYHPKEEFGPAESRRMIYAFKVRMEQDGIFGSFDCPDGSLVVPRRSVSTTPLQALNLFNSRFVLRQSEAFAGRLRKEAGGDPKSQVRRAWSLVYNRTPAPAEESEALDFLRAEGLPALCRAMFNSNEFLFIP